MGASAAEPGSTQAHVAYFDSLVDMIPPQHYFEPESDAGGLQYLKKADRQAAKRTLKQEARKKKRLKLDPTAAVTSLQIQQQRAAQNSQEQAQDEPEQQPADQRPQRSDQPAGKHMRFLRLPHSPL